MNISAVLTTACNLSCSYCFEKGAPVAVMSEEVAMKACELAAQGGGNCGVAFFGGEPLLQKELIKRMVVRCEQLGSFSFNTTTNGLLLDAEFIDFVRKHKFDIALSHDGLAQDICRCFADGSGSAQRLESVLERVVQLKRSTVMMTVSVQTVGMLAQSTAWLFDKGARRIIFTPDGRPYAGWNDENFAILEEQYEKVARDYERRLKNGESVRLPVFDQKIEAYVHGDDRCDRCRIGMKQPIVDCDGSIYPCIQFVGVPEYCIGDVFSGIDIKRRDEILAQSRQPVISCKGCAVADRCRHRCPCQNYQQTGNMNTVSAFTCTNERAVIACADRLAERLYYAELELFEKLFGQQAERAPSLENN